MVWQELYDRRASAKLSDQVKQLKMQIWSSVVTIVLMEGWNLLPMDDNGLSDPYCRFTLGTILCNSIVVWVLCSCCFSCTNLVNEFINFRKREVQKQG